MYLKWHQNCYWFKANLYNGTYKYLQVYSASRGITPGVKFVIDFRFKLIKWWAQSFLVGIPTIICGYRDDGGVVRSLEKMETLKIPQRAKAS